MQSTNFAWIYALALFFGTLAVLEFGRRFNKRQMAKDPARPGNAAIEGAVFALLGLLIAFTFSGAGARFDARRELIVQEANNIGTAWLRLDTLPAAAQPALRQLMRDYVDSRLAVYSKLPDLAAAKQELEKSFRLQSEIWSKAVEATQGPEQQSAAMLLLPALNQMFDIVTTRTAALQTHPPKIIYLLLGTMALAGAFFAGMGMAGAKHPSWIHMMAFAAILAISIYVILDFEYPRTGLIRVDAADNLLRSVRSGMQ